jgi:DegV family protein with EDD domain
MTKSLRYGTIRLIGEQQGVQKESAVAVRIVSDSSCDLPKEIVDRHGITIVPLYVNIGQKSYLDDVEISRQEFYEGLHDFETHPTTSVPGPRQFYQAYERLASEGATEILSIHISATLSALINSVRLAQEEFDAVPLTVLDSGQLTMGTGRQVLAAARAAARGHSTAEMVDLLEDQALRTHSFAALDTLEFLRRSGRLSRFQWGMGSLLQLKPLITVHAGHIGLERVRTRRRSIGRMIELVSALGPLEQLDLVHTHAPERAETLYHQAHYLFPSNATPIWAEVSPVIGTHVGPGAVGLVAIQARSG